LIITLNNANKTYKNGVAALTDFSYEFQSGSFTVLTGQSGAGKTVLLRIIAGLEDVTSGTLLFDGVPPKKGTRARDAAMMSQNPVFLKNLSVYNNLAYGLKIRKINAEEIDARVRKAAADFKLEPVLSKKTKSLSALEARRVILARAAVRTPALVLLDEPLSGLGDAGQIELCDEIARLRQSLKITTFICATSDPALASLLGGTICSLT